MILWIPINHNFVKFYVLDGRNICIDKFHRDYRIFIILKCRKLVIDLRVMLPSANLGG